MKKIVLMISLISSYSLFGALQVDGMPATKRVQTMYWTDASGQTKRGLTPEVGSTNIGINIIGIGRGPVQWKTYADFQNYIMQSRGISVFQPNIAS